MTTIRFFRGINGLEGFEASGHAEHGDAGEDIVCAAISALTQSAVIGVCEVAGAPADYEIDDGGARIRLRLKEDISPEARRDAVLLLETLSRTARQIASQYPDNVKIILKERRK